MPRGKTKKVFKLSLKAEGGSHEDLLKLLVTVGDEIKSGKLTGMDTTENGRFVFVVEEGR